MYHECFSFRTIWYIQQTEKVLIAMRDPSLFHHAASPTTTKLFDTGTIRGTPARMTEIASLRIRSSAAANENIAACEQIRLNVSINLDSTHLDVCIFDINADTPGSNHTGSKPWSQRSRRVQRGCCCLRAAAVFAPSQLIHAYIWALGDWDGRKLGCFGFSHVNRCDERARCSPRPAEIRRECL